MLKPFDGYDWSQISFPTDYSREQLTSLDLLDHAQNLVL